MTHFHHVLPPRTVITYYHHALLHRSQRQRLALVMFAVESLKDISTVIKLSLNMHQDTLSLVKLLIQAGATPGQDFSCDLHAESCHINENGFQLLQNAYPEIDWGSFAEFVEIDDQQAVDSLHQHLGINFVERILGLIQRQLRQLPSEKASWYLQQVLGGVEQRTGIPLLRYLLEQADLPRRLRVECLLHDEAAATPCSEWMTDLVIAAGGTPDDVTFDGEDAVLTERGLRLLATVWAGEYNLYDVLAQKQS